MKNEIIVFKDNGLELEVRVSPTEDTVWLSQRQMADLFEVSYETLTFTLETYSKTES